MKNKSDALKLFKQYLQDTQQIPTTLIIDPSDPSWDHTVDVLPVQLQGRRSLRHDNGGEFESAEFKEFCSTNGIVQEFSSPYTPEQHARAERPWRTLYQMARAMLDTAKLDDKFWAFAVITAVYIKNRSLHRAIKDKTPYELFFQVKPDVSHFRIWGIHKYYHVSDL